MKWIPDRKWLASGISGVLTFLVTQLIDVPPDVATPVVGGVMAVVHYAVPASVQDVLKRIDDTIIDLAKLRKTQV